MRSWENSLMYMRNIVDDPDIDGDCDIAIEYQIPLTSRRVDFLIAGKDENGYSNIVVIELKQWDSSSTTDKEALVTTHI